MRAKLLSAADPQPGFCFSCGYPLQGLEIPRACPECGNFANPQAQIAAARAWFCKQQAWWILQPRPVPVGLWYSLEDDHSRSKARRGMVFWNWLPSLLCLLTVGLGAFVTVSYDVKIWHYDSTDPLRTPRRIVTEHEDDSLFGVNVRLFRGGLFFTKPPSWVEVAEPGPARLSWKIPDYFNLALLLGLVPVFWLLAGYLPADWFIGLYAKRRQKRFGMSNLGRSARSVHSLAGQTIGLTSWLWWVALMLWAATKISWSADPWEVCSKWVVIPLILFVCWLVFTALAYERLLRNDRAGALFGWPNAFWFLFMVLEIGGPIIVMYGVTAIALLLY